MIIDAFPYILPIILDLLTTSLVPLLLAINWLYVNIRSTNSSWSDVKDYWHLYKYPQSTVLDPMSLIINILPIVIYLSVSFNSLWLVITTLLMTINYF